MTLAARPAGIHAHPFELAAAQLATRQLAALRAELDRSEVETMDAERGARYADSMCEGLRVLSGLRTSAHGALLDDCRQLARTDPRCRFVESLPRSVAFGHAMGAALAERWTGGAGSRRAAEATALMNGFITLLDGLIDEIPDELAPARVLDLLDGLSSPLDRGLPPLFTDHRSHPIVRLVGAMAERWRRMVNQNHSVHVDCFERAVERALTAERLSRRLTVPESEAWSRRELVDAAIGRSVAPVTAVALAVPCLSDSQEAFDLDAYVRIVEAIGAYLGWLDDVRDIVEDFANGRWNAVSLRLVTDDQKTSAGNDHDLLFQAIALKLDDKQSDLVEHGVSLYRRIVAESGACTSHGMRALLDDLAISWLRV